MHVPRVQHRPSRLRPADFDFRVWLAWHGSTDRLYCAVEAADDHFDNDFQRDSSNISFWSEDSGVHLQVDGDHSGGPHQFLRVGDDWQQQRDQSNREAQDYLAMGQTYDAGRHVEILQNGFGYDQPWFVEPPYADGGGGHFGEQPLLWVTEFYVTPFDLLVWDDPEQTVVSDLRAGATIGFLVTLIDTDFSVRFQTVQSFPSPSWGVFTDADAFADGVLVPRAIRLAPEEAQAPLSSWARIKAALDVAPSDAGGP